MQPFFLTTCDGYTDRNNVPMNFYMILRQSSQLQLKAWFIQFRWMLKWYKIHKNHTQVWSRSHLDLDLDPSRIYSLFTLCWVCRILQISLFCRVELTITVDDMVGSCSDNLYAIHNLKLPLITEKPEETHWTHWTWVSPSAMFEN